MKSFHEKLPDFNPTQLPDQLQAVGQIPVKRLITELASREDLVEDTTGSYSNWLYALVETFVWDVVLIVVIYKCRARCVRGPARWRGWRRKFRGCGRDLGDVDGAGVFGRGGDDALRGVAPSAPLIRGDEEPKDVDPRPEAETRPFSDSSGVVTPTTLRRCQNRESNWLLSRLAPSNVEPAAMVFWRNCGVRGGVRRGGTSRVKRHGMDDDRSNSSRDTLIFPVVPETH